MDINNQKIVFNFDKRKFNFAELLLNHLSKYHIDNLEKLHIQLPQNLMTYDVVSMEKDQSLPIYEILYSIWDSYDFINKTPTNHFLSIYEQFIYYLSDEMFNEELVYQKKPTLRVHFPGNKAVGEFHRDRDYNHPVEEINIWIPVTSASNTSSIWIESEFDKEDYSPVNLIEGEGLIFDSALKHGNKINKENLTRISFDFRVIPKSKWKTKKLHKIKSSLKQNIEFQINGYYDVMS